PGGRRRPAPLPAHLRRAAEPAAPELGRRLPRGTLRGRPGDARAGDGAEPRRRGPGGPGPGPVLAPPPGGAGPDLPARADRLRALRRPRRRVLPLRLVRR